MKCKFMMFAYLLNYYDRIEFDVDVRQVPTIFIFNMIRSDEIFVLKITHRKKITAKLIEKRVFLSYERTSYPKNPATNFISSKTIEGIFEGKATRLKNPKKSRRRVAPNLSTFRPLARYLQFFDVLQYCTSPRQTRFSVCNVKIGPVDLD